jgi:hypothetical protein
MKYLWAGLVLAACRLLAGTQDSEFNVNTRYTVETVLVAGDGWTTNLISDRDTHISSGLRKELSALIGQKLNPAALDDLAKRLRKEFRAREVQHHIMRGRMPEYVQVLFNIQIRPARFDLSVPKFLYASKLGFSGEAEAITTIGRNSFTAGVVSDGDELVERYTGLAASYENSHMGSDRVRFRFEFDHFNDRWNGYTAAAAGLQLYSSRENFEPMITFAVAGPVTFGFGTSFQRLDQSVPGARTLASDAFLTNIRFHHRLEGSVDLHDFDADYELRAGARSLASDFSYNRHRWEFRYTWTRGKQVVIDDVMGGLITGRAPLYERFVLGNSGTLRGWNKYELDPIGGNRVIHNSVEYRYGAFQMFYDAGAIWDVGEAVVARNSIGAGLREGPFSLAVAFPLKEGRVDPVIMVGMNY